MVDRIMVRNRLTYAAEHVKKRTETWFKHEHPWYLIVMEDARGVRHYSRFFPATRLNVPKHIIYDSS